MTLVAALAVVRAAETLRIVPIVREGEVLVSVEIKDLDAKQVREVISSGLRTTFTYDIELRMVVPGWVDRTVATVRDRLVRSVRQSDQTAQAVEDDRRPRRGSGGHRRRSGSAPMADDVDAEPLCDTKKLDPNRDYYVRISTRERPRGTSLFGWGPTVTGQTKFTFIP